LNPRLPAKGRKEKSRRYRQKPVKGEGKSHPNLGCRRQNGAGKNWDGGGRKKITAHTPDKSKGREKISNCDPSSRFGRCLGPEWNHERGARNKEREW